ncbi:N-acetyltransferase [Rhodococcus triatomae]|uniref:Uncharacterized protein n=1 Tax=Rhodococcus triatomae TaxID=300028 RepID=A0A1G8IDT1_9NOCA|nr:GNAT family N-acetyltransferase [Rhodococcus triatomae]QNG21027.1 N-acetyltransferase [Rhodococcus triatomae]QNG23058.1 N-acetyltransferase [Rhodococcus triatomae]SDI17043.1 hypothetical protein/hypothetical protein [Rhodococcus triatomae]
MTDAKVVHAEALHRYEIHSDDHLAGFTQYVDSGDQRIFFHTEVGEEFSGQGLAGILVQEALANTITAGKRIVPVCPYVKKYLEKHDAYADHVDPVTREALDVVRESTK